MHQPPLTTQPLTDREVEMLLQESRWYAHPGNREADIRDRFGVSLHTYLLELNALLDRPEAEAHSPRLVRSLRERRSARTMARRRVSI